LGSFFSLFFLVLFFLFVSLGFGGTVIDL